jgi:hypothetical protein
MAPDGFDRLKAALGVDRASEGDEVVLEVGGRGVLDYDRGNFVGVRTGDGLYRFFGRNAFGGPVAVVLHDFSGGDSARTKQALKRWLDSIYV